MADNTQLNTGTGGDTIRDKDRTGVKTQIVGLDINPAGSEVLGTGDATNGLDVDVTRVQGTVTVSGTVTANLAAGANAVGSVIVASASGQAADNGVLPAVCDVVAGYDGTNVQVVKTDVNGIVQVAQNGTVAITANSSVNQAQVAGTAVDTNSGVKSAGTQRVVIATDQPQLTTAWKVDGSAVTQPVSGTVTANAGSGTMATSLASLPALVTGSALVGRVNPEPQTANGLTSATLVSAATTNATSTKGSGGQLYTIFATNTNAAVRYLKFFNKASAPTVGTDVPVLTFAIPGNTAGAGLSWSTDMGIAFSLGIAFCLTTGPTTADTGAVALSEIIVNFGYK